jgi:hypothetical protein
MEVHMEVSGRVLDSGWLGVIGIISVVFISGLPELVILWDVVFDKGFCVEEGNVVVIFL